MLQIFNDYLEEHKMAIYLQQQLSSFETYAMALNWYFVSPLIEHVDLSINRDIDTLGDLATSIQDDSINHIISPTGEVVRPSSDNPYVMKWMDKADELGVRGLDVSCFIDFSVDTQKEYHKFLLSLDPDFLDSLKKI